jgi:hypothetical protein
MTRDEADSVTTAFGTEDEVVLDDFNEDPLEYLTAEEREAAYMALERISQTRREAEDQSQNLRVG